MKYQERRLIITFIYCNTFRIVRLGLEKFVIQMISHSICQTDFFLTGNAGVINFTTQSFFIFKTGGRC